MVKYDELRSTLEQAPQQTRAQADQAERRAVELSQELSDARKSAAAADADAQRQEQRAAELEQKLQLLRTSLDNARDANARQEQELQRLRAEHSASSGQHSALQSELVAARQALETEAARAAEFEQQYERRAYCRGRDAEARRGAGRSQ